MPALRDRAHPASEPRPEVLASLGFWPDCGCGECYAIHCLGNALAQLAERKMAPVQGYAAGIPWSLHLEAYDAYVKRHGRQQALIEGGCRGGFGTRELDDFIPGWRERVSEIVKLRAQLAERDRDAERYRWLRDVGDNTWTPLMKRGPAFAVNMDAAIDAAMRDRNA